MPRYQFTDEDRAKATARKKKDAETLKAFRLGVKALERVAAETSREAMLGILVTIANDKDADDHTRTRAAQAYLRESRGGGDDGAVTLEGKRSRVAELKAGGQHGHEAEGRQGQDG